MIPYAKQDITKSDIDAVQEVLGSDWLTQGPVVPEFENKVASFVGADHGIAVNSATSALHIACVAMGLGPGDWLWTSPISFVASANCALYCGASVDFVDIDPSTFNICPYELRKKLEFASINNLLPKIVILVHMAGQPSHLEEIQALAKEFGFYLIEDASHAIGAEYKGAKVGACEYSDATVFSFHPVKIITTGEGGMITTNNDEFAGKVQLLRSHGVTRDINMFSDSSTLPPPAWYYEQVCLGWNYRMTDLAAALGISQMERLNVFIENRNALADRYEDLMQMFEIDLPKVVETSRSSWHLFIIKVRNATSPKRDEIFHCLRDAGVGVNLHYMPIYRHPYYRNLNVPYKNLTNSEDYFRRAITLPLYPSMTHSDQDFVINQLAQAL